MLVLKNLATKWVICPILALMILGCGQEEIPVACSPEADECETRTEGGFQTGPAAGIAEGAAAALALAAAAGGSSGGGGSGDSPAAVNNTEVIEDTELVPNDLTSPKLSSIVPADKTSGVAIEQNLVLKFNEALLDSTVMISANATCRGSLQISANNFSNCVVGTLWAVDNTHYIFDPANNLSYSTTYLVRVGTEITDLAGNALDKQYDTSFTTVDPPPTLSETISTELRSALKASTSSGVSRNARIYVTATRSTSLTDAQMDAIVDAALATVIANGLYKSAQLGWILPEMLEGAMRGIGGLTLGSDNEILDVFHVSFSALQKSMSGKTSYLEDDTGTVSAGTVAGTLVGKALEKMSVLNFSSTDSLDDALGEVVDASVSNLDEAGVSSADLSTAVSGIANTAVKRAGDLFSTTTLGTGLEALAENLIGALDDAGVSSSSLSATTASATAALVGALGDITATSDGTTMSAGIRETLVGTMTASSIKGINRLSGVDRGALAAQVSGGAVKGVGVLAKAGKADAGNAINSLATKSATALGSLTSIDAKELATIRLAVQGTIEEQIDADTTLAAEADALKNTAASGLQDGVSESGVTDSGSTAQEYFAERISESLIQSKCIVCHVTGGVASSTPLAYTPLGTPGYVEANYNVLNNYIQNDPSRATTMLQKVLGISHGGGLILASGSTEYGYLKTFLEMIGGDTGLETARGIQEAGNE